MTSKFTSRHFPPVLISALFSLCCRYFPAEVWDVPPVHLRQRVTREDKFAVCSSALELFEQVCELTRTEKAMCRLLTVRPSVCWFAFAALDLFLSSPTPLLRNADSSPLLLYTSPSLHLNRPWYHLSCAF